MMGKRSLCVAIALFMLCLAVVPVLAHEAPAHADPELLVGWRTWLHLTVQWIHLVGLAFWFSLTAAPLLLRMTPPLSQLLYGSWALFLVLLATGDYNMEHSAGISEVPSLLLLPLMGQIPYAVTYTITLGVKLGLFFVTVLFTGVITVVHARHRFSEEALRRTFLIVGTALGILIALVGAAVLLFHESADLWPTALHSIGGVLAPEGPRGVITGSSQAPPPNDFRLLASPQVWRDIGVRWLHLLGFGLWVGGIVATLSFGGVTPGRFLFFAWTALAIQLVSGVASMNRWTPFYLPPYIWNLGALSHLRFGKTYTLFTAVKHALVLAAVAVTVIMTLRYRTGRTVAEADARSFRAILWLMLLLGLAIAYVMIIVLLIHEGVDHVL
ncbi:MAG: hypothetical protein ACE5JL_08510 [Dehalococcoidia bacterium]